MTELEAERALREACRFLGYGNPNGRFWFMGIEEGVTQAQNNPASILSRHLPEKSGWRVPLDGYGGYFSSFSIRDHWDELQRLTPGELIRKRPSSVWIYISKVLAAASGVSADCYRNLDDEYREIASPQGQSFVTEVFPLGKRSIADWPYAQWFSRETYESFVKQIRFPLLKRARPPDSILIGHGRSVWPLIRDIFCDSNDVPVRVLNTNYAYWRRKPETEVVLEIYRRAMVILAPFFSNRWMNHEIVGRIGLELNGFKKSKIL